MQALCAFHQTTNFNFCKNSLPRIFQTRNDVVTLRLKFGVSEPVLALLTSDFVCLVQMTDVRMDDQTRALCYALRTPGAGQKKMKLGAIQKLLFKKDGKSRPSLQAISQAAKTYKQPKEKRGRPKGSRNTTAAEDKILMKTFHKLRPPGHGIDSNALKRGLPRKIGKKIGRRTIIRRLAEKGFTPQKKSSKTDLSEALAKKRMVFCRKHRMKTAQGWKTYLQGVGDAKEFTWYPRELQPRFKKLRSSWTYMSKSEKKKPDFQRPKRWFPKKDWKKTKKQKVFSFTTSNGKQLVILLPSPFTSAAWATLIKSKVAPFFKRAFPNKRKFHVLMDSEPVLHGPETKAAYKKARITIEPAWPKYSPELNPQEHVWTRAEPELRRLEDGDETFEEWREMLADAINAYPAPEKLIPSMAKRVQECMARQGQMIDR